MTKQKAGSMGGQWAKQQKEGLERQERAENSAPQQRQNAPRGGQTGDNRTPDEPIGEVAYANRDPAKKKTGEF